MKNALLLLVILAASVSPVAAQSSADGLDSTLVAYYRWCNRHKQDPEMLLKADTGVYYYTTYDAAQLCAVDMHRADLNGTALACQPLDTAWRVHYQN